ncbi:MAG: hypothetical protein NDI61_06840 [Bdellovibrionaceae bacterium]|nr:hypothetical protein [Pseudobdellovibrionaceae bacterium]
MKSPHLVSLRIDASFALRALVGGLACAALLGPMTPAQAQNSASGLESTRESRSDRTANLPSCALKSTDLNAKSTLILKDFAESDGSLPDRMIIGNSIRLYSGDGETPGGMRAVQEAFYRPLKDATYAVLPLPILGVEVTRDRHVLYVCGRADMGAGAYEVTLYIMKGYHLDPSDLSTIFGNIFNAAEIKVAPVSISTINLAQLNNGILSIFNDIPIIRQLIRLPQIPILVAQAIATRLYSDFAGLGVERVILTEKYIELATGVDLENPTRARKIRRIDLKKAQALNNKLQRPFSPDSAPMEPNELVYDPSPANSEGH